MLYVPTPLCVFLYIMLLLAWQRPENLCRGRLGMLLYVPVTICALRKAEGSLCRALTQTGAAASAFAKSSTSPAVVDDAGSALRRAILLSIAPNIAPVRAG